MKQEWLNRKATDDSILGITDSLTGTKRGRSLLIITGSYAVQHVNYLNAEKKKLDIMMMNFGYLLPGAERFTWMFHGSIGYTKTFHNCSTFRYFCRDFAGSHIFMTTTAHTVGQPYPIPTKDDVIKVIQKNNIQKFFITTHAYAKKGLPYVPANLKHYSASKIPFGCGGTLNAMALPFALQLGYSNIYIAGVGDEYTTHFYDVPYVQPHLRKPAKLPMRQLTLDRYRKWQVLAKASGTNIYIIPTSCAEPSIRAIFPCVDKL